LPDEGNPAAVPIDCLKQRAHEGTVEWLGHVVDMPQLLASASIVVLPSYREGLPKTLIEAAACARPLVAADVPGCRHVVHHEVTGLLVPARDSVSLARAIARLQDDPVLARRLGEAARTMACSEFEERTIIARTLAVYDELVRTPVPATLGRQLASGNRALREVSCSAEAPSLAVKERQG